jgi:hypothetical protein
MDKEQQIIISLCEDINDMYGVDAMYYGVDSFGIANHLYNLGWRKTAASEDTQGIDNK